MSHFIVSGRKKWNKTSKKIRGELNVPVPVSGANGILKPGLYQLKTMNCVYPFPVLISDYILVVENQTQWDYLCHVCVCSQSLQSYLTLCDPRTVARQAPLSWETSGKNAGVGYHALLQRIFLTQCLKPCLLRFLHCRWILYHWATRKAPIYATRISKCYCVSFLWPSWQGSVIKVLSRLCSLWMLQGESIPCLMQLRVSPSISYPVSISLQSASVVTLPLTNSYCLILVRTHKITLRAHLANPG